MDEIKAEDAKDDPEFEEAVAEAKGGRGRLRDKLTEQNPELAKLFEEQTPEQRAWGRLIGMLILAKTNEEIEAAFDWIKDEINKGVELTYSQKAVALFHAIGSLGMDAVHYRMLRRMYIKAKYE